MKIKKNDFIEVEYVARVKNTGQIFDLTDEKTAKENKLHSHKTEYGPIVICVGQRNLVPGLDDALIGKEPGDYKIELESKDAFGGRDAKLIKIIPVSVFKKKEIMPFAGMQVNIDDAIGTIRSVSGGRSIVDFNHPLAGKAVVYDIKVLRIIENDEEKLRGFAKLHLNSDASLKEGVADVKVKLPKQLHKPLEDKIKELIPSIKEVRFEESSLEQPFEKSLGKKSPQKETSFSEKLE